MVDKKVIFDPCDCPARFDSLDMDGSLFTCTCGIQSIGNSIYVYGNHTICIPESDVLEGVIPSLKNIDGQVLDRLGQYDDGEWMRFITLTKGGWAEVWGLYNVDFGSSDEMQKYFIEQIKHYRNSAQPQNPTDRTINNEFDLMRFAGVVAMSQDGFGTTACIFDEPDISI